MNQLWAPWRMDLIEKGPAKGACIFCDLPKATDDRENLILGRTRNAFAILNKFPYHNGHLMVVPRVHTGELGKLSREEYAELDEALRAAVRLVGAAYKAQGYNVGMNLGQVAGAGIAEHLHWHVVPRWDGDTNFMPIVADVKVIVQSLDALYDLLRESLAS